ncbi:putative uncharacterized protein [Simkania negevensis Z]|uniref:Uncharacterized protein n=1 Tax=Simkania negevensis (strain ATCC VR-1471 / DSM 27360 / Z) TaxID=331113 RepID=F8L5E3_SIMNZ|nr:putative uncharacterized protein [Simkania negevensis Z]
MNKFRITIASLPDRENLVAEVFYEGVQWIEISHEVKEMVIQFYSHPSNRYWEFPLDEALNVLEKAKEKMIALGPKSPIPIDERF